MCPMHCNSERRAHKRNRMYSTTMLMYKHLTSPTCCTMGQTQSLRTHPLPLNCSAYHNRHVQLPMPHNIHFPTYLQSTQAITLYASIQLICTVRDTCMLMQLTQAASLSMMELLCIKNLGTWLGSCKAVHTTSYGIASKMQYNQSSSSHWLALRCPCDLCRKYLYTQHPLYQSAVLQSSYVQSLCTLYLPSLLIRLLCLSAPHSCRPAPV